MNGIFNNIISLTAMLAGSETVAMTALTEYAKSKDATYKYLLLILSVAIYGGFIPYMVLKSLDYEGIGTVNFMWNIITTVSMIIIGYYVFGDKVNHLHVISLMLGVASIILLYIANQQA